MEEKVSDPRPSDEQAKLKDSISGKTGTGWIIEKLADRDKKRRQKHLARSISETLGRTWFWLALLSALGFPLMDIWRKTQLQATAEGAGPSWSRIFTTNTIAALLLSLPVFLGYLTDYLTCRRKGKAWSDPRLKIAEMVILAVLILVWAVLTLAFSLSGN